MQPKPIPHRVLVIDDTPSIHDDFRKILCAPPTTSPSLEHLATSVFGTTESPEAVNFSVDSASQGKEGLALVTEAVATGRPYSVAFVDMRMPPGWDGLETIVRLWAVDPQVQVVICTAHSDHSWGTISESLGHSDKLLILKKPFDHIEALQLAHALSNKWEINRRMQEHVATLDQTVARRTSELQAAEERFSQAFNASPIALAIEALDTGTLLEVNATFSQIFGLNRADVFSRLLAQRIRQPEAEQWHAHLATLTRGEGFDEMPFTYTPLTGVVRHLRISARSVRITDRACVIWVVRDITDQVLLEQKFLHAQKMEAVGQLAAGIAHDFNNLLTIILGCASMVMTKDNLEDTIIRDVEQIHTAGRRAASLTRQLLVFSRSQITQPVRIDLSATVAHIRDMLQRLVPERIQLTFDCPSGLPCIVADPANLEHAIMNLVVNARDAIPGSGHIIIRTASVNIDAATAKRHPDARVGQFICLSIIDDGSGIPPEIMQRIFDPFFTTKPVGTGTGLGLSTVFGIAHQHAGWVEVNSTVAQGTTFSLYFPPDGEHPAEEPLHGQSQSGLLFRGNGKRILIAEDDRAVRDLVTQFAQLAGYDVTAAEDGPSALKLWQSATKPFDLLFSDVVMPNGMSGIELAERLRAEDPQLKVILATGYSSALLHADSSGLGKVPILTKPYSSVEFIDAVQLAFGTSAS